jgi:hypothetical protein
MVGVLMSAVEDAWWPSEIRGDLMTYWLEVMWRENSDELESLTTGFQDWGLSGGVVNIWSFQRSTS